MSTIDEIKKKKEEERKRQEEQKKKEMKGKMISEDGTLASFGFTDNYQSK